MIRRTGSFLYLRLRRHDYDAAALDAWAARIEPFLAAGDDVYVFFRHDAVGRAAELALELRAILLALTPGRRIRCGIRGSSGRAMPGFGTRSHRQIPASPRGPTQPGCDPGMPIGDEFLASNAGRDTARPGGAGNTGCSRRGRSSAGRGPVRLAALVIDAMGVLGRPEDHEHDELLLDVVEPMRRRRRRRTRPSPA